MRKLFLSLMVCFLAVGVSFAAEADFSVFRKIYNPQLPELQLPERVKVTLPVQDFGIVIVETTTKTPQPWARIRKIETIKASITQTSALIGSPNNLTDGKHETTAEFDLDADGGEASVIFEAMPSIISAQLKIILARNVALPRDIEIAVWDEDKWKTVLAKSRLNGSVVNFPENSANKWRVRFWHAQPLRLSELQLVDANSRVQDTGEEYVWLARPGEVYMIYADAATSTRIAAGESGNLLADTEEILEITSGVISQNPNFKEPDSDGDGVVDIRDNCVSLANLDQADLDSNGRGDACEDHDKDGVMDDKDNCPSHANRNQKDVDADGIGDVCDPTESRLTEKFPWLPWAAMVAVTIVVGFIITKTIQDARKNEEEQQ
ncbi:thrombospondin type 3 repeat-containing protein [Patescibacteria group bacterium]|nr:thrombospondin type 3 repeat-containing protein [Patescibacteria group bacterium]